MNKNLVLVIVGAIVGVALFVGGTLLPKPVTVGAIPGNNIDGNYFTIGGVDYYHIKLPILATTTVLCRVPSNVFGAATSTLVAASLNPGTGTNPLGAITFDLSTTSSSIGHSTSSPALARGFSIAAAPAIPFIWSLATTTNTQTIGVAVGANGFDGGSSNVFIRPGEGLTFRVATGTPGTYTSFLSGTCEVTLRKL